MSSSVRLFGRERTVHQIFGGGFIADVILWRRRDVTIGILMGTLAAWVLFEFSGYTLLSLVSNVTLLLFSILFVWAKAAEILNRPPPPIPEMHISTEVISEVASFAQTRLNSILSVSRDIALGKDTQLFYRVAKGLLLLSIVGNCFDFFSFAYLSLVILLSIPALYELYENIIDRYVMFTLVKLHMYEMVYEECFSKSKEWILETLKES